VDLHLDIPSDDTRDYKHRQLDRRTHDDSANDHDGGAEEDGPSPSQSIADEDSCESTKETAKRVRRHRHTLEDCLMGGLVGCGVDFGEGFDLEASVYN
jgi:hypothetical protein